MLNAGNYRLVRQVAETDFSAIYDAVHLIKETKAIVKKSKDARTCLLYTSDAADE